MSRSIDPYDVIPKYHQLASILRQKIDDGDWKPRSVIPSERQLEMLYKISRTTIREAIHHLVREGYLYREHGRGTFVSPQKLVKKLMELTSFSEDLKIRGMQPGQIILEISRIIPPAKILQKLDLPPETPVILLNRLRLGDNVPIGIQTSYINIDEDLAILRDELEKSGSLYKLCTEHFNLIPTEADETLEVTLATPEEAKLLQIEEGSPLLMSERVTYSQDRKSFEFVKILYRGDRYKYYIRLTR